MTRRQRGSAAGGRLPLLATVVLLAAAAALAAGCGATRQACTGQCQAPFELDVVFHAGTTRAAARAALHSCQANPTVVRLGRVRRLASSGDARAPLTAAVFTHSMTGSNPRRLVSCLQASHAVVTVGFPD
jgi:hypothetical protein